MSLGFDTEIWTCSSCGKEYEQTIGIPGHTPSGECPACARARQDAEYRATQIFAARSREDAQLQALAHMGVNIRVHGKMVLEDMEERIRNPCRQWVRGVMQAGPRDLIDGLYLHGEVGTGKTQTAVSIIREFMEHGWTRDRIIYDEARNLITEIQDLYGNEGKVRPYQQRREEIDVWIFDDAGTEKLTADALRIIEGIINAREGMATVITSNLKPGQWATRWEGAEGWQRLASRMQRYKMLTLTGADHRGR